MKQTGGCACEQVRYVIESEPLFIQACHCKDCQRTTGSAFVINLFVAEDDFHIVGETKATTLPTGSGSGCDPHFCAQCGTYIWTRYHRVPKGIVFVRAGTLDDASWVMPQAHLFTKNKQSWVRLSDDVPTFEFGYDRSAVWPPGSLKRFQELTAGTEHRQA